MLTVEAGEVRAEQGHPDCVAVGTGRHTVSFVSVVLPCLNEEEAVGDSVLEAIRGLRRAGHDGEVIVVDNGSTDQSVARAEAAGARVIREDRRGYGSAHLAGMEAAIGDVIVMADADLTYDLESLGSLVDELEAGTDLVVANRFTGGISDGAMPLLHRRVGTPLITAFVRLATSTQVRDSQSGYRAFWRQPMLDLHLRARGMEFASEMLLRAGRAGWTVSEVPAPYRRRVGESKLSTFADGWRHLRLLLILTPHLVLLLPGLMLTVFGLASVAIAIAFPDGLQVAQIRWAPVFAGPAMLMVGVLMTFSGALAVDVSEFAPEPLKRRVAFLKSRTALDRTLAAFVGLGLAGIVLEIALSILRAGGSDIHLLGLAGLAQALIVIGFGGMAILLGGDLARRSLES